MGTRPLQRPSDRDNRQPDADDPKQGNVAIVAFWRSILNRDPNGNRPVYGDQPLFQKDSNFKDYIQFFEYFHGDTGKGLGASHQTGWTGLVARLLTVR